MPGKKLSIGFTLALAAIAVTMFMTGTRAAAHTETVLYSFSGVNGGSEPFAGLTFDAVGNLYGTTYAGGLYGQGMVFELSPAGGGTWTEKVLYSFNPGNFRDGGNPGAPVVFDSAGNIYGTTEYGGIYNGGAAFRLAQQSNGSWAETILHSFSSSQMGGYRPTAGLTLDAAGNLYGTLSAAGVNNAGSVFELEPTAKVSWYEDVIHPFINNKRDGVQPYAGLIFDAAGNLYGTTCGGGPYLWGTVFEMSPAAGGSWSEKTLYWFRGKLNHYDGGCPQTSLVMDAKRNLYGTTVWGGPYNNYGTVFELSPNAGGGWTEKILHDFNFDGIDGYHPSGSLTIDSAGNLYGLTHDGGVNNYGAVFELTPSASGWAETILHSFNNDGVDGYEPLGGLVMDAVGNLYGTTSLGGARGGGTVFEVTP